MDDIKELLDRRASGFEPPPDGMERLLARAVRRRRDRRLGAALMVLVLVAGLGVVLWVMFPLTSGDRTVPGGGGDPSTYELSDFRIEYPYGPRSGVGPDDSLAAVSYVVSWRNGVYPGPVDCWLVLRGATGDVVGTLGLEVDSGTDGRRVASPGILVPVSDTPVSAEGTCEEGTPPSDPGYVATLVKVSRPWNSATEQPYSDRTELTFEVSSQSTGEPGMRTCSIRIFRTDGSVDEIPFGTNVSRPGAKLSFNVAGQPSTVRDAIVECGPLKSEA
jgi:hypothetical protein